MRLGIHEAEMLRAFLKQHAQMICGSARIEEARERVVTRQYLLTKDVSGFLKKRELKLLQGSDWF
jgi:hypothetical protein